NTVVRQTGNIGLDSWEPIVQIAVGSEPQVSYGKVTPFAATRIMEEHVVGGKVVRDYLIEQV
ncbi:MAG TPA: (2Fe-2S) ferredoxin domain-containing protein, partial [Anaerolineales bacterium]|nr:(2Fe-2S) ferredoxin domain-containing protein [Anaerolineales bacterium]